MEAVPENTETPIRVSVAPANLPITMLGFVSPADTIVSGPIGRCFISPFCETLYGDISPLTSFAVHRKANPVYGHHFKI